MLLCACPSACDLAALAAKLAMWGEPAKGSKRPEEAASLPSPVGVDEWGGPKKLDAQLKNLAKGVALACATVVKGLLAR